MREILLNALNIRTGGGLQKVSGFLHALAALREFRDRCQVIAGRGGAISALCRSCGLRQYAVGSGRVERALFELSCRRRFPRGCVCFNLGGLTLIRGAKYFVNLSECAFSNLFYPEVDFWSDYAGIGLVRRRLVDSYRRGAVARSDYWVFQTPSIRKRAIELCGFPENRTTVIAPSPSVAISRGMVSGAIVDAVNAALPPGFRFLFLNGAQPNKRIHLLPLIARAMVDMKCTDFCFVSTMPPRDSYARSVMRRFEEMGLARYYRNLGPVPPDDVPSVVDAGGAVCTFSRLESFSNNFVEAWKMARPLVVTDADWARDSCGAGALYVNPAEPAATAERLATLIRSETFRNDLVEQGRQQLLRFPTIEQKTALYLRRIEEAAELGPCPQSQRRAIHWPKA